MAERRNGCGGKKRDGERLTKGKKKSFTWNKKKYKETKQRNGSFISKLRRSRFAEKKRGRKGGNRAGERGNSGGKKEKDGKSRTCDQVQSLLYLI